jgi:Beta-lactamase.
VQTMWKTLPGTRMKWGRDDGYGMGWVVVPQQQEYGGGDIQKFAVGHTGGAVGASSVLLMLPDPHSSNTIPSGVAVAIITNLQGISLDHLALNVAALFCDAKNNTEQSQTQTEGG